MPDCMPAPEPVVLGLLSVQLSELPVLAFSHAAIVWKEQLVAPLFSCRQNLPLFADAASADAALRARAARTADIAIM